MVIQLFLFLWSSPGRFWWWWWWLLLLLLLILLPDQASLVHTQRFPNALSFRMMQNGDFVGWVSYE